MVAIPWHMDTIELRIPTMLISTYYHIVKHRHRQYFIINIIVFVR